MRHLHKLLNQHGFSWYCCLASLICYVHVSSADFQRAEDGLLVKGVTGSAQIYGNDVEAATDAAVRAALTRALEHTVGVHLQSNRLTVDATMLNNVIQAHSEGHARFLGHVKPPWREGDTVRVMISAWVSRQVSDEIRKKLSDPQSVLVYISESLTDNTSGQSVSVIQSELHIQMQHLLAERGYKVWFLLPEQGMQIQRALEGFAAGSIQDMLNLESKSLVQAIGLRELADAFVIGHMDINLRDFRGLPFGTVAGAKTAETVTTLRLLRIDSGTNRIQVYPYPTVIKRGSAGQVDRAIQYATSDTIEAAQPLMDQLEAWTGPPNRMIIVYIERMPSLFVYEDFQDQLRQFSALGVEVVRGVVFTSEMSKIVLTFSQQSLINGDLAQQVEYLATAIDERQNYTVKRTGNRTILLRYASDY